MVKPLEWWEEAQLNVLESLGYDVTRFRENPDEWRATRERLRALHEKKT